MRADAREIKSRIDLIDYLAAHGVELAPVGTRDEYRGRCPFHDESTPSFHANRMKGLWHCFGCGAGGDVISFVMKQEGLRFREALAVLAGTTQQPAGNVLTAAVAFWQGCLTRSRSARRYLERRGIGADEILERYRVGFAPGGTRTQDALRDAGFSSNEIAAAGLVNTRGLDSVFGRVTVPLLEKGDVVNVYGRSLSTHHRHRYLPGRRDVLFNIERVQRHEAILTESVIDTLSLVALGVPNAISGLSVHLTSRQLERLAARFAEIEIAFDADAAGEAGAQAVAAYLEKNGVRTRILRLSAGSDLNALLAAGLSREGFEEIRRREVPSR
jgi:DNA primase